MSRLTLLLPIALSAVACSGCSGASDRESEPSATRSAIAFLRGDPEEFELVVVDPDGGNERVLVKRSPGRELLEFSWSPTGRQLLYVEATPDDNNIDDEYPVDVYVVDADGSDRRILRRANTWTDLVWSPDGDAILIGDASVGARELSVVNAAGSGSRKIPVSEDIWNFAWSPDGTKIAYDDSDASVVSVMNADGSAPKRLTDGFDPEWLPGGQILFRYALEDWLINPDGSGLRRAGRAGELNALGELAPDGRTIALSKAVDGSDYELVLGDIGGGPLKRLTHNDMHDEFPFWSPDGKSLVFERRSSDHSPGDIYVINVDGTGERNLTESPADESEPAWAP